MRLLPKTAAALFCALFAACATAQWRPADGKILSRWGKALDASDVLPEYPRPQMERPQWKNLNGLWNYAIADAGAAYQKPDGKILVPFAVESALSGVGRKLGARQRLWYERGFSIPEEWRGKRVLLHFGAVDYRCKIFVNDVAVAEHEGGYDPFSADITDALKDGENRLKVCVADPTDDPAGCCLQPRGKQSLNPPWYMYSAVSGIWQTVWLEPAPRKRIEAVSFAPDIDNAALAIKISAPKDCSFTAEVFDGGKVAARVSARCGEAAVARIENAKLWSPENPFLYGVEITLIDGGAPVDKVKSYAAMRKISLLRTHKDPTLARTKIALNNKPIFLMGVVDQGYWPDGLYTAPTDGALKFDIETAKRLGFNTIRKHLKIEPARWYYHCDRLGMLVWQDMPCAINNAQKIKWAPGRYIGDDAGTLPAAWLETYRRDFRAMIDNLYSHPCIIAWVLFNEAWGQSDTARTAEWAKSLDPSRLINPASGGNMLAGCGDIVDSHNYPEPRIIYFENLKANVIGEFGALHHSVKGHMWTDGKTWGQGKYESSDELMEKYDEYADTIIGLQKHGLCGALYFELADVEREANGIITCDREVVKFPREKMSMTNARVIQAYK